MTTTNRPSAPTAAARVRLTEHQREALLSGITSGPVGAIHPMTGLRTGESLERRGLVAWTANQWVLTDAGRAAVGHPTPAAAVAALVEIDDQRPADDDTDQGITVALSDTAAVNARWDALAADQATEQGREDAAVAVLVARTGHYADCLRERVGAILENDALNVATGDVPADYVRSVDSLAEDAADLDCRDWAECHDDQATEVDSLFAHNVRPGMVLTNRIDGVDLTIVQVGVDGMDDYAVAVPVTGDDRSPRTVQMDQGTGMVQVRVAATPAPVADDAPRALVAEHADAIVRGSAYVGQDHQRVTVPAGTVVSVLPHPVPAYVSLVGETAGQPFLFVVRATEVDTVAPVATDPDVMGEARGWLADCGLPTGGDDAAIVARVGREYDGGWSAFLAATVPAPGDAHGPVAAADTAAAPSGRARSAERVTFLSDVLCAALEGGIGYWSAADAIVRVPEADGIVGWRYDAVTLFETADGDDACSVTDGPCQGHRVTLDTIATAVNKISKTKRADCPAAGGFHYGYVNTVRDASMENDGGEIDADVADIIVQVAALGSVVYG